MPSSTSRATDAFSGVVLSGDVATFAGTEQRMKTDGNLILLNGAEPVIVTNVSKNDGAVEVELVSSRRVWVSFGAVTWNN